MVPTKTVPQGITAMINYMPDAEHRKKSGSNDGRRSENVKTGQVTYAVRDTHD